MVHDCMDRTIMDRAACFVFVSCTIRPRAQRGRAAGFRPRYRYAGYPTSEVDYFVALVTKRAHGLPNTEMTKPCVVSVTCSPRQSLSSAQLLIKIYMSLHLQCRVERAMCMGIFGTKNSRTKVSISRDDIQELDTSKHSRDEPPSEPPSPLPSRRLRMSKEGLASVRGADAQLVTEVLQLRKVNFDELQKPMKYLGSGEFCEALLSKLDGKNVVVKMLKQEQQNNPTAVKDLLSEGALMLTMRHKNILAGIAHGLDDHGLPFVVIEQLESVLSAELPKSADSVPFWTRSAQVKK